MKPNYLVKTNPTGKIAAAGLGITDIRQLKHEVYGRHPLVRLNKSFKDKKYFLLLSANINVSTVLYRHSQLKTGGKKLHVTPCLISLWLKTLPFTASQITYKNWMPLFFYLKETHFLSFFVR